MTPEQAGRHTRDGLCGVEQARDSRRETGGGRWLEQFVNDLRYACRAFGRERAFMTVALLILAIGVGLNTTVFSLVNTTILRPLPFAEARRLIWIANHPTRDWSGFTSQIDTWEGLQETNRTLDRLEAYYPFSALRTWRLAARGEPETAIGYGVSTGLFDLLGLQPLHGRMFMAEDGGNQAPFRVVLSHQLWQRRFEANPGVVGRTIRLDGRAAEVIGVMPADENFAGVFSPAVRIDFYWPINRDGLRGSGNTVALVGRMKPGVTAARAQADLTLAIDELKHKHPERGTWYWANLTPLKDYILGDLHGPLLFLWGAAGLAFAIVGFNFGGLLLARGAARRKELALRLALGANRGRIVRQLLTECSVLVGIGSALGAVSAMGLIHFLAVRSAMEIPLLRSVRLDGAALGFTVSLCAATAALCGLLPAWQLTRARDLERQLKDQLRGSTHAGRSRTQSALVVVEVALACMLVLSAGLMVRSFTKLLQVNLGFAPDNVLVARIDALVPPERTSAYFEAILERVRALPAVGHAALTDCIPVERDRSWGAYPVNAENPKDQRWTGAHVRIVSPDSFAAMGTHLLAGRDFARTDDAGQEPVIIINRTMSELFWPGQNPIGRFVAATYPDPAPRRVVGVVEDVYHSGPAATPGNEMYFPLRQNTWERSFDLLVRARRPGSAILADLRTALHEADPALPVTMIRPLSVLVDRTLSSRQLLVSLVAGFAVLALGLATLGLYGLISYTVTQQTKEIGIRMALGADAAAVQKEVVKRTMKLALMGVTLGVIAALSAGRLLQSLLFGVTANDPVAYGIMILALLGCAFVAGYLPARRASRIDPATALRAE